MRIISSRILAVIGLAGMAFGLSAVQVGARSKTPPPPVIEAPPPMPPVALAERFIAEAAAYEDYMRQATLISPAFSDAAGVQQSLRTGAAYEPGGFLRGEIAYAAIAALQDQTFVAAVRARGQTPQSRYAIVAKIYADPANAFSFPGARDAAGMAKFALADPGMRLFNAGKAVKLAAYSIQHQPWSLQDVVDRDGRLEAVKALSHSPRSVSSLETQDMQRRASGEPDPHAVADPAPPPYSPLIVRAVALAALAAVGQAGDDDAAHLTWLFDDYFTTHCIAQAKLALNECLAVARPNYEDVFCLGQHAMNDTGSCVVRGAGSVIPLEIRTQSFPVPPPTRAASAHHAHRRPS
jgi:hypothetical protein